MRKGINSRTKGSDYERKIAKSLSLWFEEEFNRVPQSGGLHWKEDNRVAGDIVTPIGSKFPFTVECKKREGWDLEQVLKGTGDVEKWWKQALGDSQRVSTIPMLVFSKNFAPNYLMINHDVFKKVLDHKGNPKVPFNYFIVHRPDVETRVVCVLEEFAEFASKDDIINSLVG